MPNGCSSGPTRMMTNMGCGFLYEDVQTPCRVLSILGNRLLTAMRMVSVRFLSGSAGLVAPYCRLAPLTLGASQTMSVADLYAYLMSRRMASMREGQRRDGAQGSPRHHNRERETAWVSPQVDLKIDKYRRMRRMTAREPMS